MIININYKILCKYIKISKYRTNNTQFIYLVYNVIISEIYIDTINNKNIKQKSSFYFLYKYWKTFYPNMKKIKIHQFILCKTNLQCNVKLLFQKNSIFYY